MSPRPFAVLGLALAALTCRDALEPAPSGRIAVAPILPSAAALADFGLTIDGVRFVVVRPASDTLADTTLALPPTATELALDLRVPLIANPETLSVSVLALSGAIPLFTGTRLVRVPTPLPPPEIPVDTYIGPAADSIVIQPRSPFILLNDSLRFQVQGFNGGVPVTQFFVAWSTSDTTVARINGFGVLRAPAGRAAVRVRARTPSGASDSVLATFVPLPTQLVPVPGAPQSGTAGQPLATPFEVEVRAADGLGVGGVAVRFRSLSGGAPADTTVTSDVLGRARVTGVLGPITGAQSFEATLPTFPGVAAATFNVTAAAGAMSASTSVVTVSAASIASGGTVTLALQGKDAAGNTITTGGAAVVFSASGGTSSGTIGATTDNGDGTYTATFTAQLAGTATIISATIDGTPVTTPLPTIAVTAGAISASASVVTVSASTVTSGATATLMLQAKDAAGNNLTAGGAAVAFTQSGGTSTGTIGATTDSGNGTYTAPFTGETAGTATTIGATINGSPVTTTLPTITVTPGGATRLVFLQQPPPTAFFGDVLTPAIRVAAQDAFGNVDPTFVGNVFLSEDTTKSTNRVSVLQGTLTQPAVAGVATFNGLSFSGTDTTAITAVADPLAPAASNTIFVIDRIVLTQADGIGGGPYFAGVDTATNRAYVSSPLGRSVSIVDGAQSKVVAPLTIGSSPGWEGVNPVTRRVFVADSVDGAVSVIDESKLVVENTILLGRGATQPAVETDSNRFYVPARPNVLSLFVIDGSTAKVLGNVPIGGTVDHAAGAVWDAKRRLVWVVVQSQNSVKSVDPAQLRVVDSIFVGESPYGIAWDPVLDRLYVTLALQAQVWVYDPVNKTLLPAITVGQMPQGLSVDPKTGRVFVANYGDGLKPGSVSVIDGSKGVVIRTIGVGVGPGDAEFNAVNGRLYVPNAIDGTLWIIKP